MDTELLELKRWLKKNDMTLRKYAPNEIAQMALTLGFSREVVYGGISDNVTYLKRLLVFWENEILAEKWMRVTSYEHGNDYEEAA